MGGVSFQTDCDQSATVPNSTPNSAFVTSSQQACLTACVDDATCNLYTFNGYTSTCYLYDDDSDVAQSLSTSSNPGYAFGVYAPGQC